MASVTIFPTAHTLGTNGSNFINPTNLRANDGTHCTVTQTTKNITSQIFLESFSHSIPSGSTINSVVVNVERKMSTTGSIQSVAIQAYKLSTAVGTKTTSTAEPTTDTVLSNANTGSWVWSDLANLRVLLENIRGNSTVACTISYDYVSVTIDYTLPLEQHSGSASVSFASSVGASGKMGGKGTSQASASVTVVSVGKKSVGGLSAVSILASILASGRKSVGGSATISSLAQAVANGLKKAYGSGGTSASSTVVSSGKKNAKGTASVSIGSGSASTGKLNAKGSASAEAQITVFAVGFADVPEIESHEGSASVSFVGSVSASGKKTAKGLADVEIYLVIESQGKKHAFGEANVTSVGTVVASYAVGVLKNIKKAIKKTVVMRGSIENLITSKQKVVVSKKIESIKANGQTKGPITKGVTIVND